MGAFGIACEAIPLNPVIVEIPDTTMNEDGNITMGLYATSQLGYSMTFTITSDTADVNPSYDGAILNLIPTPDWNGSALITVIVTDENSLSDSTEFTLTVLPVNDAPTISAINDTIILEDSWDQFINISGISSGSSNESQSFVLSATTNNSELIFLNPGHDFTYTSPDSIGTFSFSTIANAYGEATITIMVQDDGGIENGGIDTVRISFNVSVTSVNDIPIIEEIFSQYVYEDSTLTIAIYASDVEDEYLEIFAYSQGPGVETFIFGSDSLLMVPEPDWNGETLIDVYTFDSQGAGDTMSFTLNVIPVDDNPFLSGYLNDVYFYEDFGDTSIVELDSVFTDIDGELTFSFELMDSSFVQANLNDGFLQFTAIPDSSGLTMLILTASNPTRAEISDTIEVRVFAVNDAPVIDGIDSIIFEEDQSYSLMSFVQLFDQNIISDIDNTIESLNFEWSVDVESIQIEWDGNLNSNPMIIPEPDFFGMGTLTLCVFDGEYEVCSENIVTITPVNDAPFFISELSGFVGVGIGFDIPLELGDIDSDSLIITIEPDSTTPDWVNLINQTFSGTAPFQGNFFIPLQVSDGDTVIVDTFILSVENFNPEITSITDVPDDQGGRVYVAFNASFFDHLDETNQNYGIMRFDSFEDTVAWVALTSFPAIGDEQYIFEVLTLGDSTANDDGLTEFKVVASMNAGVFHSNSVWGYSVDNIAPGVPTGLIATAMEENIQVIWDLSPEDDFQYFLLEKSMTSEFTEYESISTTDTAYTDLEYEMNQPYFYRLAVADHADNVSDYSEVVEIAVLAIDGNLIPDVFALHQNYPNPFNPVTTISYDLPEVAQVVISIYDIMGREVKTLVNLEQIAGFKSVVWDATNNMGQPVSAGMYLYRITALQQNGGQAGSFHQVKKMVLLK
ncbi:MAG: T9SS type A sorting domain-containing protein [Candidatus Marinimicrobia bacterium]|nr:T9SS type A sorting domain-containing protein [Candidatus Neomarinimicrobiota bacterium]MBT3839191.1 T9SS type A sorting domain-containing protein [Candidatus Neomarinimicrobiota bacterium]